MIEKITNLFKNIGTSIPILSDLSDVITIIDNELSWNLSNFSNDSIIIETLDNKINIVINKSLTKPLHVFLIGTRLNKSLFNFNVNVSEFVNLDVSFFIMDDSKSELRGNINFILNDTSTAKTRVLYINKFSSKYDINLSTHHVASNSTSDVNVKGVVYRDSDITFNMKIIVDRLLQSITSTEVHKVLKLSPSAIVRSIPAIVCATEGSVINHGFALSGFDKSQLSFLLSRGINQVDVEVLLKDAFIASLY